MANAFETSRARSKPSRLRAWMHQAARTWRPRPDVVRLEDLSDHLLRDLGLTRDGISTLRYRSTVDDELQPPSPSTPVTRTPPRPGPQPDHGKGSPAASDIGGTTLPRQTTSAALATLALALPAWADPQTRSDVAEDHTRFVFAPAPVQDDGQPAFGNPFVTQGFNCETGTLDGGLEGVNPGGSPVLSDEVIGTWTFDGHFVRDGAPVQNNLGMGEGAGTRIPFMIETSASHAPLEP